MSYEILYPLLSQIKFEIIIFMDIKAIGTIGLMRFMLNDYTYDGAPNFYLNIAELESENDLVGLNVGHPINIDPKIVEEAESIARVQMLNPDETQLMIISYVLTKDRIEAKLGEKRGGCPKEMSHIFSILKSSDEKAILAQISNKSKTDVKALRSKSI